MSEHLGSGSAKGLIDYMDSLVQQGRSRSGVVIPLKTALLKVLEETEGDQWEQVAITKIDVSDVMTRFKNLTLGKYTDASYSAYESRIKRAIKWYENFLANPGWFPKEKARTPKAGTRSADSNNSGEVSNAKNAKKATETRNDSAQTNVSDSVSELPKLEAIAYPFPLANGETARIYMPKGITKLDVKRLSSFLEALVIGAEE